MIKICRANKRYRTYYIARYGSAILIIIGNIQVRVRVGVWIWIWVRVSLIGDIHTPYVEWSPIVNGFPFSKNNRVVPSESAV
jgi:hypothetical protein